MDTLNGDQMTHKNEDGIYLKREHLLCDRSSFEESAENVKAYIDSIVEKAKEEGMVGTGRFIFHLAGVHYEGECQFDVYYEFDCAETEKEKENRENAEATLKKLQLPKRKMKADAEYVDFIRLNGDQMPHKNEDGIYLKRDRIMCDRSSFEGSAESVKAYVDSIVKKAKEKGMLGDGKFAFYPMPVYYDGEYELDVYYEFDRPETEKEKEKREKAEAKFKEAVAAAEKKNEG